MLTSPLSLYAVTHCVIGGGAGSWLLPISSPWLVLLLPSVPRVSEEFPSPPHPRLSYPGTPLFLRVTLEVSSPWGNSSTLVLLVPLGNLTPPTTP